MLKYTSANIQNRDKFSMRNLLIKAGIIIGTLSFCVFAFANSGIDYSTHGKFIPRSQSENMVVQVRPQILKDTPLVYSLKAITVPKNKEDVTISFPVNSGSSATFYLANKRAFHLGSLKHFITKTMEFPGLTERDIIYTQYTPLLLSPTYTKHTKTANPNHTGFVLTLNFNGLSHRLHIKLTRKEVIPSSKKETNKIIPFSTTRNIAFNQDKLLVIAWNSKQAYIDKTKPKIKGYSLRNVTNLLIISAHLKPGFFRGQDQKAVVLRKAIDLKN
jgi:hypothetical protein